MFPQQFQENFEKNLRELFARAKGVNEVEFAVALFPEMRGAQGPGWNTALEAQRAFRQYIDFLNDFLGNPIRPRVMLAFYCHLAEASGLYETPKNMLRVVSGERANLWPFKNLVTTHKITGESIAPNATAVIKDLVGHCTELGLIDLAEVFRDAFNSDIRNAFAHADYVIEQEGINLPRRNGGIPKTVSWDTFDDALACAISMFQTIWKLTNEAMLSYEPEKRIIGSFAGGPIETIVIYCNRDSGTFGIRNAPID